MWLSPIALDFWQILPSFASLEIEIAINLTASARPKVLHYPLLASINPAVKV